MPCTSPCRLYIHHLAFTYSVGPSSIVWSSKLGLAPPFPPNESAWSVMVMGSQSRLWSGPKCCDFGWPKISIVTKFFYTQLCHSIRKLARYSECPNPTWNPRVSNSTRNPRFWDVIFWPTCDRLKNLRVALKSRGCLHTSFWRLDKEARSMVLRINVLGSHVLNGLTQVYQ